MGSTAVPEPDIVAVVIVEDSFATITFELSEV